MKKLELKLELEPEPELERELELKLKLKWKWKLSRLGAKRCDINQKAICAREEAAGTLYVQMG